MKRRLGAAEGLAIMSRNLDHVSIRLAKKLIWLQKTWQKIKKKLKKSDLYAKT